MVKCLVIKRWERSDLLALLCVMLSCVFLTYPYSVPGQVWYLIVLIPDLCLLLYFPSVDTRWSIVHLSHDMGFPTICYVRPAKPQISLRIRAVWSEPLLVVWIFYDCQAHRGLTQSKCGVILYESCQWCFMKGLQVLYDFLNQYKVGDGKLH